MPVKNAAAWLEECLHSIQNQSFRDWELWAADDGSEDRSFEVLQQFASEDQRIHTLQSKGKGISDALQCAYERATASFITRMDADDKMPPDKLQVMYNSALERPQAVVTGKVQYFGVKPVSEGYRSYETWINQRVDACDHTRWMYRECVVAGANWFCHRSLLPERFDSLSYPEDYDLVFYWLEKGIPIRGIDAITHWWREHPQRTSRNHEHYSQNAFFELKLSRFLKIDRDKDRALVILGSGPKSKLAARILEDQGQHPVLIDQSNLKTLDLMNRPQVLVAVYPNAGQRLAIEGLLSGMKLEMGIDWWWL